MQALIVHGGSPTDPPAPKESPRPQGSPTLGPLYVRCMLTLRSTRLSGDSNRQDWTVHEDGEQIGRLYEDVNATRPENQWFWAIQVMGPARDLVRTDGRAATLKEAKAQFAASWKAFKAANRAPRNRPR